MSAPEGGGLQQAFAWVQAAIAAFKQTWEVFILPSVLGWWSWRRWSAGRADEKAKGDRTEQERRDDAWRARFDRLGAQEQEMFKRREAERDRAEARADRLDGEMDRLRAEHDAAVRRLEREGRRMELYARDLEHTVNNLRRLVDELEGKAGGPRRDWPPLDRPEPPGEG